MKKITALFLSILMILSLGACQKAANPEDVYASAVDKMSKLDSVDMDMDMKIKADAGGFSMEIQVDMGIQQVKKSNSDLQLKTTMGMSLAGQELGASIYYRDGTCYVNTEMSGMAQKVKADVDVEEILEKYGNSTSMMTLKPETLKDLKGERQSDGSYVFTYSADADDLKDFMNSFSDTMGNSADMDDLKINAITGETVVNKEGYISSMNLVLDCSAAEEGQEVNMTLEIDATINNPGGEVVIDFPDFSDYEEVDSSEVL